MGEGPTPRGIGPRVLHRSQRPHDLPFSRLATVHHQPAGQGPCQKKQLSFQRGCPGGVGGPGSPGLSRRSSAVLPAPPSQGPPSPSLTRLTLTRALPWRLRGRGTRRGPVAGGEGTRPGSAAFFSFPPCSPLCYVSVTLRCEKTKTNKPNTRNTNNQKITFTSEAPGPPSGAAEVGQRVGSGARRCLDSSR